MTIYSSLPNANTEYVLDFGLTANETLGSIGVQFCSNSPIVGQSCVVPPGFNVQNAVLSAQSGVAGFSVSNASTANYLILSRTPSVALAGQLQFTLTNVINPSVVGTYFARIQTYATDNASGLAMDYGGIALSTTSGYTVSATVPPYILFCVGITISNFSCNQAQGDFINFGNLSTGSVSSAQSQMLVETNAQNGYSILLNGNTMVSGNNVLPPLSSDSISIPGTDQFGLNLSANNSPNIGQAPQGPGSGTPTPAYQTPNYFKFANGDTVASSTVASEYREFTASYIININKSQPPGVYSTTLTYTGIGNF